MILNTDNGYYSRRNTRGRLSGGVAGLFGMGDCQWVGDQWVNVLHNGSVEGCGAPPPAPTIPDTSAGAAIINAGAANAANPYLQSPAYLQAVAAAEGAPVPTPQEQTQQSLQYYCQTNADNVITFGTPADTATCIGAQVNPSVLAQVPAVFTSPNLPNALTASAPAPTAFPAPAHATNVLSKSAPSPAPSTPSPGAVSQTQNNALSPGTTVNGVPPPPPPPPATCGGIGVGSCLGPLDLGTWGLIAAGVGVVAVFVMMGKK